MDDMTIFDTRKLTATMTEDGELAVITFKPNSHPPVCIRLPRASLERFLAQASDELSAWSRRHTL